MKETLIQQAARHRAETGCSINSAAVKFGVPPSSLYAHFARNELQKLRGKVECPCCQSQVDPAKIDESALSASGKKKLSK
jgi:hypothetical protein